MPEVKKTALVLVTFDEIERIEEALRDKVAEDSAEDDDNVVLLGKVIESRRKMEG